MGREAPTEPFPDVGPRSASSVHSRTQGLGSEAASKAAAAAAAAACGLNPARAPAQARRRRWRRDRCRLRRRSRRRGHDSKSAGPRRAAERQQVASGSGMCDERARCTRERSAIEARLRCDRTRTASMPLRPRSGRLNLLRCAVALIRLAPALFLTVWRTVVSAVTSHARVSYQYLSYI